MSQALGERQCAVLHAVSEGVCDLPSLCTASGVSPAETRRILRRLERLGLVCRLADGPDLWTWVAK